MSNPNVVVIGGAVVDFVFLIPEFPQWKEAVQAEEFSLVPGGKGLNQAVAAGNLGGNVSLISAIGDDYFGRQILDNLEEHSVSHDYVEKVANDQTAVTNVFVSTENAQASFLGYKSVTDSEHVVDAVRQAEDAIKNADAILMTLEVPLEAIKTALDIANEEPDPPVSILNPAPPLSPHEFEPDLLRRIRILVPNRWEAKKLIRDTTDASASELARWLQQAGAPIACVTDAEKGCVVATEDWDEIKEFDAFRPLTVDTTGASDAFCGSLGVSVAKGDLSLKAAIIKANAAAACVIDKKAASPSMPTSDEVKHILTGYKEYLEEERVASELNIGSS